MRGGRGRGARVDTCHALVEQDLYPAVSRLCVLVWWLIHKMFRKSSRLRVTQCITGWGLCSRIPCACDPSLTPVSLCIYAAGVGRGQLHVCWCIGLPQLLCEQPVRQWTPAGLQLQQGDEALGCGGQDLSVHCAHRPAAAVPRWVMGVRWVMKGGCSEPVCITCADVCWCLYLVAAFCHSSS
jgi:hypothetical protein